MRNHWEVRNAALLAVLSINAAVFLSVVSNLQDVINHQVDPVILSNVVERAKLIQRKWRNQTAY